MGTKYIFVTGGVVSSVGKGVSVASIVRILKSRGISVSVLKLDPYLNVDPGTMSPYQHGEVFVTKDGGETDLFGGERVAKDDLRVEAYGDVDELNAALGVCRAQSAQSDLREILERDNP